MCIFPVKDTARKRERHSYSESERKKLMFQLVINQVLGWMISASHGMWNNTDLHGFASDLINLFFVDNQKTWRTHTVTPDYDKKQ